MSLCIVSSCELIEGLDKDGNKITIHGEASLNIAGTEGEIIINFASNASWTAAVEYKGTASDQLDWCTIKDHSSGDKGDNCSLTLNIKEQSGNNYDTRYADIIISPAGGSENKGIVTIAQGPLETILADPFSQSNVELRNDELFFELGITKNPNEVEVSILEDSFSPPLGGNEPWLKLGTKEDSHPTTKNSEDVDQIEPPKHYTLYFTTEKNEYAGDRSAVIVLKYNELKTYVKVNQRVDDSHTDISMLDANLKTYILANYDFNKDGEMSTVELNYVKEMSVPSMEITHLQGLEIFQNLQYLDCSNNDLSSADLSKNTKLTTLRCNYNYLYGNGLNISNNTALQELNCSNNSLTSIDLSNNIALEELDFSDNNISKLDISKNTNLRRLMCTSQKNDGTHTGQLSKIDISNNKELTLLNCSENPIFLLDLQYNTKLEQLDCSTTGISELDLSNNNELTLLYCEYNNVKLIDLSDKRKLKSLRLRSDYLEVLTLSKNYELDNILFGGYNQNGNKGKVSELNLSDSPKLNSLEFYGQSITEINLHNNRELTTLTCNDNKLASLDVSDNKLLKTLICNNNDIKILNLSENTVLKELNISQNPISELGLSKNRILSSINCRQTSLMTLDVSRTSINNSEHTMPLNCSGNSNLKTLYLTKGWMINKINVSRSEDYIPSQTLIEYLKH